MPIPALTIPMEPGMYYHVYNRGNNKEKLFFSQGDYQVFLRKYSLYLDSYVTTYAYCLLDNHFHFLIRIKDELPDQPSTVSNQFRKLFISHSRRINRERNRTGCLLTRNFRRIQINNERYLLNVIRYIHFNPIKHGYVQNLVQYPYSSFTEFTFKNSSFVAQEEVLNWFGGIEGFLEQHWGLEKDPEVLGLLHHD